MSRTRRKREGGKSWEITLKSYSSGFSFFSSLEEKSKRSNLLNGSNVPLSLSLPPP